MTVNNCIHDVKRCLNFPCNERVWLMQGRVDWKFVVEVIELAIGLCRVKTSRN